MRPHPRIRRTIQWVGAAVTLLLLVVWIASGWFSVERIDTSEAAITVRYGCVSMCMMRGVLPSAVGTHWSGPSPWAVQWWSSRHASHSGMVLSLPIWWAVALLAMLTASAWLADAIARRRAGMNRCVECGYDRAGLRAEAVCPECGKASVMS